MQNLLNRIENYFSNEYMGSDETAPKLELNVSELRKITGMYVDRCKAETELKEARKMIEEIKYIINEKDYPDAAECDYGNFSECDYALALADIRKVLHID